MDRYIKIENSTSLVRDMTSGAIINTNRAAKEAFRRKQEAQLDLQEQVKQNAEKIDKIESDISDIKQMLMLLVNKDK